MSEQEAKVYDQQVLKTTTLFDLSYHENFTFDEDECVVCWGDNIGWVFWGLLPSERAL